MGSRASYELWRAENDLTYKDWNFSFLIDYNMG